MQVIRDRRFSVVTECGGDWKKAPSHATSTNRAGNGHEFIYSIPEHGEAGNKQKNVGMKSYMTRVNLGNKHTQMRHIDIVKKIMFVDIAS